MNDIFDVLIQLTQLIGIIAFFIALIVRDIRAKKYVWAATAAICALLVFSLPMRFPGMKVAMPGPAKAQ